MITDDHGQFPAVPQSIPLSLQHTSTQPVTEAHQVSGEYEMVAIGVKNFLDSTQKGQQIPKSRG